MCVCVCVFICRNPRRSSLKKWSNFTCAWIFAQNKVDRKQSSTLPISWFYIKTHNCLEKQTTKRRTERFAFIPELESWLQRPSTLRPPLPSPGRRGLASVGGATTKRGREKPVKVKGIGRQAWTTPCSNTYMPFPNAAKYLDWRRKKNLSLGQIEMCFQFPILGFSCPVGN